ncbi:hypothetical protein [Agrobacterium tumefaciens]|nr:hypothetical protein [Agrobacterium tumefaciens]NSY97921.1 hypothetical protein [Agrobacterium tumefaciens]
MAQERRPAHRKRKPEMTPERYEELKNYIRGTISADMAPEAMQKAFMERFGKEKFTDIEKAMAEVNAELEAERGKPAMVLLPEGFDLLDLPAGSYQGALTVIDKGIIKCVSETLKRLSEGFDREAKWFAREVQEAKDGDYDESDKDFYTLLPFRKNADLHLSNLERGAEMISQIVAQLTLIGEQFNIPEKTEAAE